MEPQGIEPWSQQFRHAELLLVDASLGPLYSVPAVHFDYPFVRAIFTGIEDDSSCNQVCYDAYHFFFSFAEYFTHAFDPSVIESVGHTARNCEPTVPSTRARTLVANSASASWVPKSPLTRPKLFPPPV